MSPQPAASPEAAAARSDNPTAALGDPPDGAHVDRQRPDDVHLSTRRQRSTAAAAGQDGYNAPNQWQKIDKLVATGSVGNREHDPVHKLTSLEDDRGDHASNDDEDQRGRASPVVVEEGRKDEARTSRLATRVYTLSYLIFFSLLGTLARLGLTALTQYPGSPVIFGTVWANFGGSLVMGFLAEDRMLFRHGDKSEEVASAASNEGAQEDVVAAKKAHLAVKKTIPLYIGLATGFCGSFTSFSSFIRDIFLAMSNDLATPGVPRPGSRSGGNSFMALLAVVTTTACLSLGGLFLGAHIASALGQFTPSLPRSLMRLFLDPVCVVLAWGCWLGAVLLSIFPPHEAWRGRATFSLVFAPLGCLLRFYLAVHLNGRVSSFPMGTFVANVFGTAILAMAWDIAHVPIGGVIGCQVLQGVEDGFCGCLTTISTWVAELSSLRRRHAYTYGFASVVLSFALMVVVMGGLRWTDGFSPLNCG